MEIGRLIAEENLKLWPLGYELDKVRQLNPDGREAIAARDLAASDS
jgi:hypothetical protein